MAPLPKKKLLIFLLIGLVFIIFIPLTLSRLLTHTKAPPFGKDILLFSAFTLSDLEKSFLKDRENADSISFKILNPIGKALYSFGDEKVPSNDCEYYIREYKEKMHPYTWMRTIPEKVSATPEQAAEVILGALTSSCKKDWLKGYYQAQTIMGSSQYWYNKVSETTVLQTAPRILAAYYLLDRDTNIHSPDFRENEDYFRGYYSYLALINHTSAILINDDPSKNWCNSEAYKVFVSTKEKFKNYKLLSVSAPALVTAENITRACNN